MKKIKNILRKRNGSIRHQLTDSVLTAATAAADAICAPPDITKAKKVLFVQPHPDDNQIGAGGTIARMIDMGIEVYELTVLDDRYTDLTYNGEGFTIRQQEALNAQKILGIKNAGFLGFGDRTTATDREISKKLVEVIRKIKPDAVFTVDPSLLTECHEDHLKVGNAVKYAVLDAGFDFYPEYVDGKPRTDTHNVKTLGFYYTDKPNVIVDIGDYEDIKFRSIYAHESQKNVGINAALRLQSQYFAQGTDYKAAEALRLQNGLHNHCFNLPVE